MGEKPKKAGDQRTIRPDEKGTVTRGITEKVGQRFGWSFFFSFFDKKKSQGGW